ncbi:hypothetical protein RD110_13845 [Rhodoferax koreense]|uniref:Uncharacterized protein n=1 Tax=Rhodoferax koreensis TaxID=1842727 RepID=A0A1P8JWM2_9BURK|nr:hypothetical protein [Rhodoferax koreense]APW38145.1 hypothetical protein RD110_13845 [Rhodoferax koreense]
MNDQIAAALHALLMAQAGQIRAMQVINDTLITTIGRASPELLDALNESIGTVTHWGAENLEEGSLDSYHAMIGSTTRLIETLQDS